VAGPKRSDREEPTTPGEWVPPVELTAELPPQSMPRASMPPQRKPTEMTAAMPLARAKRPSVAEPLPTHGVQRIGKFELIREIARGGMGQVFLGRDTKLGRKVAIKVLLHDEPQFVPRFLVEARATARCTHENIVTIYEVGEHAGLPYMALEYLEGKTLSEVLESKPPLRQFLELMVPVLRALERAHADGIVHRDLKPSNIFVTDRGQVKVLDFGVARLMERSEATLERAASSFALPEFDDDMDSSVTFTRTSSLVGTLPYMSPEQWKGGDVDHQSDIWAFGIMFWRALTGVHPAGTMAPDKLRDRLTDLSTPLPSIGTRRPDLPRPIVELVDRCLAKRKLERYQSTTQVLADLQAYLSPDRLATGECPYRGLAAFGEDDAKYFFGRGNEIRTAVRQLEDWPLLAVIGPSGVGKSSFVHAGLIPAIRSTDGDWRVHVIRPGRAPLQRLANTLDELATGESLPGRAPPQHTANTLDELATDESLDTLGQLAESPGLFGAALRRTAAKRNQRVLVVVDQLEELFTLGDDEQVRATFLAALLAAADDPTSPVRVVLSMRADFLDRLAGHKQFLAELSRGLFFLTAPDRENLRDTLVRPAELAGYTFEDPWILEDMLEAATSRGALSLLSFAAMRLWDSRDRTTKRLTVSAYNQMGGIGGAFARHADQIAQAVPPDDQILLRAIVTRLVTPERTRAVVDRDELLSLSDDRAAIERILDQLLRGRLIQVHTDEGATIEIVHEMLISEWPLLDRWLEEGNAVRGFVHELRQAAKQWATRGRPADLVWRGATATEALGYAKRHVLDLSVVEKDFLKAIRQQVARSRRRKVFGYVAVFGVLALIAAGAAIAAVQIKLAETEARNQRDEAVKAQREVQGKLDIIEAERRRRTDAEHNRAAAEERRKVAEQDLAKAAKSEELTKDQLEVANAELRRRVSEAQAAKDKERAARDKERAAKEKAQAAELAARKATEEARAAKAATEVMLAAERAKREKLEREKKSIIDVDLTKGGKK